MLSLNLSLILIKQNHYLQAHLGFDTSYGGEVIHALVHGLFFETGIKF